MLHMRETLGTRKVSPPQPVCMSTEQKGMFMNSLVSKLYGTDREKCHLEVQHGILFTHTWHQLHTLPIYETIDRPDRRVLGPYLRDLFLHKMRIFHPELARLFPPTHHPRKLSKKEWCRGNRSWLIELLCPSLTHSAH